MPTAVIRDIKYLTYWYGGVYVLTGTEESDSTNTRPGKLLFELEAIQR